MVTNRNLERVQSGDGIPLCAGRQMGVAERGGDVGVTEDLLHLLEAPDDRDLGGRLFDRRSS